MSAGAAQSQRDAHASSLLRGVLSDMAMARDAASSASREIDGKLVALGDAVGTLLEGSGSLWRQVERLELLLRDSQALRLAESLVHESAELAERSLAQTREIDGTLATIGDEIAGLRAREDEFADAVMGFWMLIIAIRIEASRFNSGERKEVLQLASTMTGIHSELKAVIHVHFARGDTVRGVLRGLRGRITEVSRRTERQAEDARSHVRGLLDALAATLEQVAGQQERVRGCVARMREDFSAIILSLQFQDIIRQKLEGVASAFDQAVAMRFEVAEAQLAFAHVVATVSEQQLARAKQELEHLQKTIVERVRSLVSLSEELLNVTRELRGRAAAALARAAGGDAFFRSLSELHGASGAAATIVHELQGVIERLKAHGVEQVEALTTLGTNLRHVAINAQIVAARTLGGSALENLAIQTRVNSDEMLQATRAIAGAHETMLERLGGVDQAIAQLLELAAGRQEALQMEAREAERELQQMTREIVAGLVESDHDAGRGNGRILELLPHASFGDAVVARIDALSLVCAATARATREVGERWRDEPSVRERLESLRLIYVMEAQRAAHDQVLDQPGASAPDGAGPRAGLAPAETEATTDDNIELF